MPTYRYKAITATGSVVAGTSEALSEAMLAEHLRKQGQFPISASEVGSRNFAERVATLLRYRSKPTLRTLATVTQELASLLAAGLELDRAISTLAGLSDIGAYREPIASVRQRVRDGATLADALAREDSFPAFYVNMVRAGEFGGALDKTLTKLADYLSRSLATREAVTSALIYPAVLLVTMGLSIVIILFFVLPEFEPLFAESGRALPWATQALMDMSRFLRSFWWALLALVAGMSVAGREAWRKPAIRQWVDHQMLRLPLIGDLLLSMEVERFSRALGTLVNNGVALPTALKLSANVLWNSPLRNAVAEASTGLREGASLSQRLAQTGVFPAMTLDLIQIGEETGRLDVMLLRQADLDEQRIRHALDRLLALLVPVLTIVLGIVVAGLISSMLVAILSVNDLALQ